MAMQPEKHFLRNIFRLIAIVQEVPADTEDHRLVFTHQLAKIQRGLRFGLQFGQCASVA
jgi:hypothetical protein